MNCKWLVLVTELCVFLVMHYSTQGEAGLTVTPASTTCPGVDMTFICSKTSTAGASISNIRWKLLRDGTEVIPQLALSQDGCSYLYSHYNSLPILITLYNSYSTLNITADEQLDGLSVECLLVSDTVERETLQIQIMQIPSSPTDLCITSTYHGSYSAVVELQWDSPTVADDTTYAISVASNGEIWTITAARADARRMSITLSYNTNYTLDVTAKNCAGHSARGAFNMMDVFIANCSVPVFTSGVVTELYNNTVEGSVIYLNCDKGLVPNERRMVVCQSDGQWSTSLSNIKCELDKTATRDETRELTNEEFLFQCERDSGIFLALCTQDVTVNCTEIDQETQAGPGLLIYQRIEVLVGLIVASVVLGIICSGCLLMLACLITKKKRDTVTENKKIELNENMAYETIPFPKSID